MGRTTRLLSVGDAEALAGVLTANRTCLEPWEPLRDDIYFTPDGQRVDLENSLEAYSSERSVPLAILDAQGQLVGRINLNGITRGAMQSATVGYWVSESHTGRGIATAAVREVVQLAFGELQLHRVQAETLFHNTGSQRVLERNGFRPFGIAPAHVRIAGRWQDFIMYSLINPEDLS